MSKKGFTLIELLAVVTIIALLSILVIPNIVGNIDKKKGEISEANMKLLATATDVYIENNSTRYAHTFESSGSTYCIPIQSLINDNVLETPFKDVTGEEIDYSKVMKAVYSDTYNTFEYDLVNASECTEFVNYVNRPELDSNMIPVIYENGKWLKADINSKWYNYSDKNWANAVYVKEQKDNNTQNSKSRYEYKDALPGTEVLESDILAYFVWIPRFRYQLFDNTLQTINIAFESTSTKKSNGMTTGQWLTHPAFTYNNQELSGIWVAKYETSNINNNLVIKPNQTPWTNIDYNRATNASTNMTNQNNVYGLENINTHLTQNNEWAAVAYLTNSIYGINQKIEPSDSTQTGNSTSTTNNMTGIFDMSGVSKELVTITEENENSLGSALLETKSWYNETNTFTTAQNIFLTRGQTSIFNYSSTKSNDSTTSFRITLINKDITSNNDIQIPTVMIVDNVKYYDTNWIGITPIYYNPVTGKSCTNYHEDNSKTGYNGTNSTTDNQTSCLKWYAYSEQNGSVNLLLDHNTTATSAWVTKDDYGSGIPELAATLGITYPSGSIVGSDAYGNNGNWNKGPITLLKQLKADTDGWGGVASRTDSYTSSNNYNSETVIDRYTINYSGYKARIITAQEVAYITGNKSFDEKNTIIKKFYFDSKTADLSPTCKSGDTSGCSYSWLHDRTSTSCTQYGCLNNSEEATYGYWTISPGWWFSSPSWLVYASNLLSSANVPDPNGLRPVITVSKSSIFES